jgi:hypothetical protein
MLKNILVIIQHVEKLANGFIIMIMDILRGLKTIKKSMIVAQMRYLMVYGNISMSRVF